MCAAEERPASWTFPPLQGISARAFACCIAEWLNRNPVGSPRGRCVACGGAGHEDDPLLPYGVEITEAVAALEATGIAAPAEVPDDFGKNGSA
jgi:hypothetical protein